MSKITVGQENAADIEPRHEPVRAGDVRHSFADLTRARLDLSYGPIVGLYEGLTRTLLYYAHELSEAATATARAPAQLGA